MKRAALAAAIALIAVPTANAGWPLHPTNQQHPIRGGFLDPRGLKDLEDRTSYLGFHKGIDIAVKEDKPRSVYTISPGVVWGIGGQNGGCTHIRVGYFGYGHVRLLRNLRNGQKLPKGKVVGKTCPGQGYWHVHISEFTVKRDLSKYRNPLSPGSRFRRWANFEDTAPPVIHEVVYDGVDTYIKAADRLSYQGWFETEHPALMNEVHPYKLIVDGQLLWRVLRPPPDSTFWTHYGSRTRKNWRCYEYPQDSPVTQCQGEYWFKVPNTAQTIELQDTEGNFTRWTR